MTKVNTIIFDLSDVLIKGLIGSERYLGQYAHEITAKDFFMPELDDLFLGKISEVEYWQIVLKKRGWKLSLENMKFAVRKNFKEIKGVREIIERLRRKYKLGLLSVHAKEWVEFCQAKYNYHSLFDAISYSFNELVCKPDKRAFEIILNYLKSKPDESLLIDDSLKNIQSAEELGIKGILFESPLQLKKDLANFSIKIH